MLGRSRPLTRALGAGLLLASSVAFAPRPAFAGNTVIAESMYQEGVKLMKAGKFKDACPKLEESLRQDHAAGTLLALADCNEKIGKNASAWAEFKELSFELKKRNKMEMAQQAADRANALEPKLSKLIINAAGNTPGLSIRRDKEEVGMAILGTPVAIDPGEHIVEVTAPGFQVWQTTIVIGATADTQTVAIPPLAPLAKVKTGPNKGLLYAGIGVGVVGVAGLAVGGAFGGLAMSQASGAKGDKTLCPGNTCTPAGRSAIDAASTKATISTIGVAAGGALTVTGIVLIAVSGAFKKGDESKAPPDGAPSPVKIQAFTPTFGPQGGGFSLSGAF